MADDTLTDDDLWQIVRDRGPSLGALARCIAQLDAELRAARTRLTACEAVVAAAEARAAEVKRKYPLIAAGELPSYVSTADVRAALGVDGD